ncbi:MAG: CsbD family protein [Thermoanaerobaculaceae bacterium]
MKKVQGQVKEAVGKITDNRKLEREGSRERAEGAAQESLGKARRKVSEFVGGIAKAIKK